MHPSIYAPSNHLSIHPFHHPTTQADVYEELSNPWGEAMQCNDEMEQLSAGPRGSNPKLAAARPLQPSLQPTG